MWIPYQTGWYFRCLRLRLNETWFGSYNLPARHIVLCNVASPIDVRHNSANDQIEHAEYTANDKQDEIEESVDVCFPNWLAIDLLLIWNIFILFLYGKTRSTSFYSRVNRLHSGSVKSTLWTMPLPANWIMHFPNYRNSRPNWQAYSFVVCMR